VTVLRDGHYVGRRSMADTDRAELIAMMVGRPLGQLYPRCLYTHLTLPTICSV
jgi:ribose transport system ATP-binding protein